MTFKRFNPEDIIHSTLVAKPEFNFIIVSGNTYINNEYSVSGDFSNKIKHLKQGEVSLYEMNINRPTGSLVHQFVSRDSTRFSFRTVTNSAFDADSQFGNELTITQSYPLTSSMSRIFVPAGQEFDSNVYNLGASFSHNNKKYIRALRNALESQASLTQKPEGYANMGSKKANIICVPGIFYGSQMYRESLELNYYVTGTLNSQLKDSRGDGVLVETKGENPGAPAGYVLYNHGLIILTGAWAQHSSYTDKYYKLDSSSAPSWLTFGTGLRQVGTPLPHGTVISSSYEVKFKGTNKIPTLTMKAHAAKSEFNFSNNPTFIDKESETSDSISDSDYYQKESNVKNITYSTATAHSASYQNRTYISKVGIYDENKNLIAVATLANPVKKTEFQDYTFKLRLDF